MYMEEQELVGKRRLNSRKESQNPDQGLQKFLTILTSSKARVTCSIG
jgi:hypothetical protein